MTSFPLRGLHRTKVPSGLSKAGGSDFLIPRVGIGEARKSDEPDSPGGGTRPTGIPVPVGPVPSPGVSRIFRGIRESEAGGLRFDRQP